ncbi:MAG: 4Fe-4S binding protein [Rhodocyclales bacterium]|nr:4Fe-4S binding protein [Rhodocyclales bacterium]
MAVTRAARWWACAATAAAVLLAHASAVFAGDLERADIARRFPPPLRVGDKLRDVPVWPLTSELAPDAGPAGYVFESIDLAPIPGFEGTPINLLVAVDAEGRFLDVEVLRQHEPVFLGGLGPAPLHEFVRQYKGHSLRQEIVVASTYGTGQRNERRVVLDGVAKATASVRIVNQSVLGAALTVARRRLGFADRGSNAPATVVRDLPFEAMGFDELLRRGLVQRLRLSNADVEALFAGSDGAGIDAEALSDPAGLFVELYVAYLNAPTTGRNLLGDAGWTKLRGDLGDDRPAFWVATRGRYALADDSFVPGTAPPRLALAQRGLPLELRDANRDYAHGPGPTDLNAALILTVPAYAGLDPGQPMEFGLNISRARGMILPVVTQKNADLQYRPVAELFDYPAAAPPEWLVAWQGRAVDLVVIAVALALLTSILARPRWISVEPRRLYVFRLAFLAFTAIYLGWFAQGQLSIVQVTGAIKSISAGAGLASFLYDPVSLLLIAYTAVTLLVWGRGAFCGWLCPFGALQEFVTLAARALRLPQLSLPAGVAGALARGRYAILAMLAGAAALAPASAEWLVEIEPFKTSITVGFAREWPFVAWAAGLLVAGVFVYKFFCRYLCPLGAALTLGGRLRRWDWLPRIDACGKPCQKCRRACTYDAIAPAGNIRYDDCFQCLDCVGLVHDVRRCGPQLLLARKGRSIRIRPLPAALHPASPSR